MHLAKLAIASSALAVAAPALAHPNHAANASLSSGDIAGMLAVLAVAALGALLYRSSRQDSAPVRKELRK